MQGFILLAITAADKICWQMEEGTSQGMNGWIDGKLTWQMILWRNYHFLSFNYQPQISTIFIVPAYSKVQYRGSTFRLSVRPSVNNSCQGALLWSSDSWEYETLHSNYPWHTLQAGTLTRCHWPSFHSPLTFSKFCV